MNMQSDPNTPENLSDLDYRHKDEKSPSVLKTKSDLSENSTQADPTFDFPSHFFLSRLKVKVKGLILSHYFKVFQNSIFIVEGPTKYQNVCLTKLFWKYVIHFYTPPANKVEGGLYWFEPVCLSVRSSGREHLSRQYLKNASYFLAIWQPKNLENYT